MHLPHSPATLHALTGHVAALERLGLGDALPAVRAAHAHAAKLDEATRSAVAGFDQLADRLAAEVADGTTDPDTAVDAVADAARRSDRDGAGYRVMAKATSLATSRAWALLNAEGDKLVTGLLAPEVDRAVADIADTARRLPGTVFDEATARAAGAKAPTAWDRLTTRHQRWLDLHALADALRGDAVITLAPLDPLNTARDEFRYRHPDKLTEPGPGSPPLPSPLRLAADYANGAGPSLLTSAEVAVARTWKQTSVGAGA